MLESLVVENAFRGVETIEGDVRIEGGSRWEIGSVDDESLISVIICVIAYKMITKPKAEQYN